MVDWTAVTDPLNLTRAECAQRAEVIGDPAYDIHVDLSHAAVPTATTFTSHTRLTFDASGPHSWVDLAAAQIESATLNGRAVDTSGYDGARLALTDLLPHNELVVTARCAFRNTGDGLHRFTDPQDGNTYLYTHFEPTDARRMFACFEQPDLKARFTLTVRAPQDWAVRSNQPLATDRTSEGVTVHEFATTPLMSTYLVALAAGPYALAESGHIIERADGSTQPVALGLLCRQSMRAALETEDLFAVTGQGLDFYDAHFGTPYPWGKYDQVFVPEYNIGAMENPGLVSWNESFLFRGGSTHAQRGARAEVLMHEMAHMWFGDLATMRWWDGLWLKESFADLMGYQVAQAATRYRDGWVQLALGRKQWAYLEDRLPTTHPIEADIPDLQAARQNFDGISYAKGAATLKQLQAYVGEKEFFAGARRYFADHAFGSTTLSDLVRAMEQSSGLDLSDWARVWWQTAGPSYLHPVVSRGPDGTITSLHVEQSGVDLATGQEILRPHRFTVALFAATDDGLRPAGELPVTLVDHRVAVPQATGMRADLIVLNAQDETYAVARLDETSLRTVEAHLGTVGPDLTRAVTWSTVWNMVGDAELSAARFGRMLRGQAAAETNASVLTVLLNLGYQAVADFTPAQHRSQEAAASLRWCLDHAAQQPAGSDEFRLWCRGVGNVSALTDAFGDEVAILARDPRLDPELRWRLADSLAATGHWSVADLDQQLSDDDTMTGRTAYAQAVAARPGRAVKEQVWRTLAGGGTLSNDHRRALLAGYAHRFSAADAYPDFPAYLDSLLRWWHELGEIDAQRMVSALFPHPDIADGDVESNPFVVAGRAWLVEHADAPAALRRSVQKAVAIAERALVAQAAY